MPVFVLHIDRRNKNKINIKFSRVIERYVGQSVLKISSAITLRILFTNQIFTFVFSIFFFFGGEGFIKAARSNYYDYTGKRSSGRKIRVKFHQFLHST